LEPSQPRYGVRFRSDGEECKTDCWRTITDLQTLGEDDLHPCRISKNPTGVTLSSGAAQKIDCGWPNRYDLIVLEDTPTATSVYW